MKERKLRTYEFFGKKGVVRYFSYGRKGSTENWLDLLKAGTEKYGDSFELRNIYAYKNHLYKIL